MPRIGVRANASSCGFVLPAVVGPALVAMAAGIAAPVPMLPSSPRMSAVPVDVVDRASTYEVTATDAVGLTREMAERGPQHPTGRRAWAYTAWELRAQYTLERSRHDCALLDARVVLVVTTTLPAWKPGRPAPGALRQAWRRVLDAARTHEAVHRGHGIDAAHAAAAGIADARTAATCAAVETHVRTVLRRASDAAAARSRQFDRETDFGRRAGMRLGD